MTCILHEWYCAEVMKCGMDRACSSQMMNCETFSSKHVAGGRPFVVFICRREVVLILTVRLWVRKGLGGYCAHGNEHADSIQTERIW